MDSQTGLSLAWLEAELREARRRLQSGRVSILETSPDNLQNSQQQQPHGPSFADSLEAELDRAASALRAEAVSIESAARALLLDADALAREEKGAGGDSSSSSSTGTSGASEAAVADLQSRARQISERALHLQGRARGDASELRRVAQLADTQLGLACGDVMERRLRVEPWTLDASRGGLVTVLLNDVYSIARELAEGKRNKVAEQSVVGKGQNDGGGGKWVPPSSFERVTTKYWAQEADLSQVVLASIADLPLLVYGRKGGRILDCNKDVRTQAAASQADSGLWESLTSSISSVYLDSPNMRLYKERLKRSEGAQLLRIRWYGAKPQGEEVVFLELKTHHEKWFGDKSIKERVALRERDVPLLLDTSNGRWDIERATDLVRLANRTEDKDLTDDLSNLLLLIRELICKYNLSPCVRTCYTRIALQSTSTNKTRLTIDRDIRLINERASSSRNSWCLEDKDTIPADAMVKIPYCVFEVKIGTTDDLPPFVADLEDSKTIVEAKKFSKFLSGASVFNAGTIETLPWWASDDAFAPLYDKSRGSSTATCSSTGVDSSNASSRTDISSTDYVAPSTTTAALPDKSDPDKRKARRRSTFSAARASFLPMTRNQQAIASKAPPRVEPKSHFANERTFIQWISAALLLITISQLLFILGADRNMREASIAASWLIAMSLFIAIYALAIYYRRIYLMTTGKPYGYVDWGGPAVLTASIVVGVVVLLVYSHRAENNPSPLAPSTLSYEQGQCVRRSLKGIPILELQPSGAAIDKEKNLLLVPTLHRIVALENALPANQDDDQSVQVVANIPGANLEALEFVDDKLYALSEGSGSSAIIALEWTQEHLYGKHFLETHRWEIGIQGAEAMTVVPSQEIGGTPKLVVAGFSDKRLSIDVFDLGSFSNDVDAVQKYSTFNKKTIAKGLTANEQKVGSIQYFGGLLHILFDNARIIRAFDIETGEVVQETKLPIAEEGSELEWEGMRLERISQISTSSFRGSTVTDDVLVLHLALDTPAQVWSLRLTEDDADTRQWALPACAK